MKRCRHDSQDPGAIHRAENSLPQEEAASSAASNRREAASGQTDEQKNASQENAAHLVAK